MLPCLWLIQPRPLLPEQAPSLQQTHGAGCGSFPPYGTGLVVPALHPLSDGGFLTCPVLRPGSHMHAHASQDHSHGHPCCLPSRRGWLTSGCSHQVWPAGCRDGAAPQSAGPGSRSDWAARRWYRRHSAHVLGDSSSRADSATRSAAGTVRGALLSTNRAYGWGCSVGSTEYSGEMRREEAGEEEEGLRGCKNVAFSQRLVF